MRHDQPNYSAGTGTVAAIGGHPLHPMVVPLPIAAFIIALLTDLAFVATGDSAWPVVSQWLIGFGLATGAVAAILGIIELMSISRARSLGRAWLHGAANVIVLALALVNFLIRRYDPVNPVLYGGLALSVLVVVVLSVAGWLGGELVYRHGIGVSRTIGPGYDVGNEDRTPEGKPDIGQG